MLRTTILGIVAMNAWNNIPQEIQWVAVLSILLLISNTLIKIVKPITYILKGGYSVAKWIGTKITIPIGKITNAIRLEQTYIYKIDSLEKELLGREQDIKAYIEKIRILKEHNKNLIQCNDNQAKMLSANPENKNIFKGIRMINKNV